jgi:hypothetical protein
LRTLQGKSLQDPISTSDWVWWYVPVIPAKQRSTNRRFSVQASLGIKQDPVLKIMQKVVECLPSKHKALSSTPSTTKTRTRTTNKTKQKTRESF